MLVSSINWNSVSPNFNREAGVIIDHPGVGRYFLAVFEDDWKPSAKPLGATTNYLKIGIIAIVLVLLLFVYYRRRKV